MDAFQKLVARTARIARRFEVDPEDLAMLVWEEAWEKGVEISFTLIYHRAIDLARSKNCERNHLRMVPIPTCYTTTITPRQQLSEELDSLHLSSTEASVLYYRKGIDASLEETAKCLSLTTELVKQIERQVELKIKETKESNER